MFELVTEYNGDCSLGNGDVCDATRHRHVTVVATFHIKSETSTKTLSFSAISIPART